MIIGNRYKLKGNIYVIYFIFYGANAVNPFVGLSAPDGKTPSPLTAFRFG